MLAVGRVQVDQPQAHHLRDVLRLRAGDGVELFDDSGQVGEGVLIEVSAGRVLAEVREVRLVKQPLAWTVAAALPKGPRADWMVEKLSELGTTRFIPLIAQRSVVVPEGTAKRDRWVRIAAESAKQARRPGTMQIDPPTPLAELLRAIGRGCYLSTGPEAQAASDAMRDLAEAGSQELTLLIGPEGGWADSEVASFEKAGLTAISLGATILRVETAAICAAGLVAAILSPLIEARQSRENST